MADSKKINVNTYLKTVLISPLDWGLGHTTRCIPIIRSFLKFSCKVVVACNSAQKNILEKEFPGIEYISLQGYKVSYGRNKIFTKFRLLIQIPKILMSIKEELRWIDEYIQQNKVDLIISDNRYGFYNRTVPSVFITHQMSVHTGFGRISDRLVSSRLLKLIERFSICWVPDFKGPGSLAGKLSNPARLPSIPVRYIGPLTRFNFQENHIDNEVPGKVLVILSGPEPQRSKLEGILLDQLGSLIQKQVLKIRPTLIRGVVASLPLPSSKQVDLINFSASDELRRQVEEAELIICRSGYSSIMDLLSLKKKLVLIPTPGQGEQEYLGKELHTKGYAYCVEQDQFDLELILGSINKFDFKQFPPGQENLDDAIHEVMQSYLCSSKSIS